MAGITNRMLRAAKLDAQLYEEVEADKSSMQQAMMVVVMSSLAAGLATLAQGGIVGLVVGTLAALVSWYIWAYLTYFIGTKLFPEQQTRADHGELLRTLGFASAPGVIRILGIIPALSVIVFPVAGIWMLVATVIAVRQALDYKSTPRAVLVCLVGWLVQGLLLGLLLDVRSEDFGDDDVRDLRQGACCHGKPPLVVRSDLVREARAGRRGAARWRELPSSPPCESSIPVRENGSEAPAVGSSLPNRI